MEQTKYKRPFLTFIVHFICFLFIYSLCSTLIETIDTGVNTHFVYILKRLIQFTLYVVFICILHNISNEKFDYPIRFKVNHFLLSIAAIFSIIVFYENSIQLLIDNYLSFDTLFLGEESNSANEMFRYPIPLFIQTCITAPIAEELIIRGYLLKILRRKYSSGVALIFSSLFFAILHFDFVNTLFYFILGLLLGYVFIKLHSLLYCILLHFLINFLAVTSYYNGFELFENGFHLYALIVSGIIGIISILSIVRLSLPCQK